MSLNRMIRRMFKGATCAPLPFFTVAAASVILPARGEGLNAFSYIQKGLSACYDGVENAGAGVHDPNATTWADLTGHGNTGTVASGITWSANGWVSTGNVPLPILLGPSIAAVTGSKHFTMEFTGTRATTARGALFGQYATKYGLNFEYATSSYVLRLYFN